jgi:hypothetical protein
MAIKQPVPWNDSRDAHSLLLRKEFSANAIKAKMIMPFNEMIKMAEIVIVGAIIVDQGIQMLTSGWTRKTRPHS